MTNSKSTKRALLLSALSILMCVAMLVGTTFAWFTDSASTAVNKIQAGTLDVDLQVAASYDENGNPNEWKSAEGEVLNFVAKDGSEEILWEPGCTYELPALRIVNKGKLALKYKVVISGINGDAKLNEAIDWYYSTQLLPSDLMPDAYGWTTPTDLYSLDNFGDGEGYVLLPEGETYLTYTNTSVFKILGHMKEEAGNEYQDLSIDGVAITVVATQFTYEYDSFNKTYDANATYPDVWDGETVTVPTATDGVYHITNAAEFVAYIQAVNAGNPFIFEGHRFDDVNVVLDTDVDLNGYTLEVAAEPYTFTGSFDGQGHTVSNFTVNRTGSGEYYAGLFGYLGDGCVKNLTVKNATINAAAYGNVGVIAGAIYGNASVENCHVFDCTVNGAKKVGGVVGGSWGTVENCSAANNTISSGRPAESGAIVGFQG